jgi:hypothetical protein
MRALILLLSVIVLNTSVLEAQITLTATTSNPLPGDTAIFYRATANPGASGAGVTWDFSNLVPSSKGTLTYISTGASSPPATPLAGFYSTPTIGYSIYFIADNDSLAVGDFYSGSSAYGSNPLTILRYPMAFNGPTYTDSFLFEAYSKSGIMHDEAGSQIISVDAYGTLILPDSVCNNVLRIKRVVIKDMSIPDYQFNPPTFIKYRTVDEEYEWYSAFRRTYLLKIVKHISTADINEGISVSRQVSVYPNPAAQILNIKVEEVNRTVTGISLYNVEGKEAMSVTGAKGKELYLLNTSDIPKGLYYLHIKSDKGKIVEKVLVR